MALNSLQRLKGRGGGGGGVGQNTDPQSMDYLNGPPLNISGKTKKKTVLSMSLTVFFLSCVYFGKLCGLFSLVLSIGGKRPRGWTVTHVSKPFCPLVVNKNYGDHFPHHKSWHAKFLQILSNFKNCDKIHKTVYLTVLTQMLFFAFPVHSSSHGLGVIVLSSLKIECIPETPPWHQWWLLGAG